MAQAWHTCEEPAWLMATIWGSSLSVAAHAFAVCVCTVPGLPELYLPSGTAPCVSNGVTRKKADKNNSALSPVRWLHCTTGLSLFFFIITGAAGAGQTGCALPHAPQCRARGCGHPAGGGEAGLAGRARGRQELQQVSCICSPVWWVLATLTFLAWQSMYASNDKRVRLRCSACKHMHMVFT